MALAAPVFRFLCCGVALVTLAFVPTCARADTPGEALSVASTALPKRPPSLAEMQDLQVAAVGQKKEEANEDLNPEIRMEGLKEAALSYGARGGLASRTYEIRETLLKKEAYLDRIYDFKRLLITAPSGLMIEPPVISEAEDAMIIGEQGQTAAVADRVYNINVDAQIVAAPRNWRAYLERDWGDVTPPPAILYPETESERTFWLNALKEGWEQGVAQANEVFQADLDRLNADFRGMIRYRMLLAQGIVSAPFTLQTDRGITGGGKEMRVGDRALQITGPSQLQTGAYQWQPASR